MEKEEFLRLLPKLIRESDEVKGAIITALSGVVATKEDIKEVIKEFDKRFEAMTIKVDILDVGLNKKIDKLDVAIGALGQRSGKSLEKSILNILKDKLIQENIQASEIKKVYLTDVDGIIFSKNATTDVDVVIEDGKTVLIEIKYRPDQDDVERFLNIAKLYKSIKKPYDQLLIIALEIKRKHYDYANQKGIKVISGKIIEKK